MAKIIIIEDSVYKVTEKQFKEIKTREGMLLDDNDFEWEMDDFLNRFKDNYRFIGKINYQFRI